MASDLEKKAKEAFIDDHFQLAADLYSQAIDLSPNSPELFVDRAQANIKLGNFTEAVSDANKAIQLDSSIARAYLRKGIACMKLEEYQTAKAALDAGLSVRIDFPEEDAYHLQHRLFGKIVPASCKYIVLSTKVEIRLAKAEPIHWTSLEYQETSVVRRVDTSSEVVKRPAYPSSKLTKVDWDKLEAQVKQEEKDEKLDGDAGLNKFFREIYKDADEDTRRAMQKSFVESNGTVLSTNWKDIGSKKVEGSAPDGMEMRKWEY
ncbi:Protein SGT1 homolog A [Linum perenne]